MSWRVIIRPKAEADLLAAREWYEALRAGLVHTTRSDLPLGGGTRMVRSIV